MLIKKFSVSNFKWSGGETSTGTSRGSHTE